MSNARKYLDQLFISKVRIKAIKYFFTNPDKPIHLRGAVRELNEEINAVRRELSRMEDIKLVSGEKKGNRKYFSLNPDFVFYDELLGMVFKSFGLGAEILSSERKLGEIKYAVLTQKYTRKKPFGTHLIDLVVVGDVDMRLMEQLVSAEEQRNKTQVHYTVLSESDFAMRCKRKDSFVLELMLQSKTMLIGDSVSFVSQMVV